MTKDTDVGLGFSVQQRLRPSFVSFPLHIAHDGRQYGFLPVRPRPPTEIRSAHHSSTLPETAVTGAIFFNC